MFLGKDQGCGSTLIPCNMFLFRNELAGGSSKLQMRFIEIFGYLFWKVQGTNM